jgi:hypothetical protein
MKERWTRGKRVERADTRVLEEVGGEDWRELDGILAATRRFADSVAAAGDIAQEVCRWERRCDAAVSSWEKSVLIRSITNSAGLVYNGIC